MDEKILNECKISGNGVSSICIVRQEDIKQMKAENGLITEIKMKRKYGKHNREIISIDFNNKEEK